LEVPTVAAIKKNTTKIQQIRKPMLKKAERRLDKKLNKKPEKKPGKKVAKDRAASLPEKADLKLVTIDRRIGHDRRKPSGPASAERHLERRTKVNRRRQIDPTTCERDYTLEEIEFMKALDDYKRANGRMFPTCSEVLEVIHKLGYEKRPLPAPAAVVEMPVVESPTPAAAV
jgi:hypothetical protein